MLSPVLFCVCNDERMRVLAVAGTGYYMRNVFVGALAYADDIVLIDLSATAMRKLLSICDEYTDQGRLFLYLGGANAPP